MGAIHSTHVHPQVDYYHCAQTMPYRYISSRLDAKYTSVLYPRNYLLDYVICHMTMGPIRKKCSRYRLT